MALALAAAVLHARRFAGNDLAVFRTAAARLLAGQDLYPASDGFYAWRYAPGAAAVFAPLAALSYPAARVAWPLAIAAALGLAAWLTGRRLRPGAWWAAPLAVLAILRPAIDELHNLNANALALLLAVGAWTADEEDRPWLAGALLAVAAALKVTPALLAVDWLLRRRGRALAGLAAGLAALALLPVLTHGPSGAIALHLGWLGSEGGASDRMWGRIENQSAWSMALALGLGKPGGALLALAVVLVAASARPPWRAPLLLAAAPLATPYGWIQNFVFLLPCAAAALAAGRRVAVPAFLLAAALWIPTYDVAGPRLEALLETWKVPGLLGLGLVLWVRFGAYDHPGPALPLPRAPGPGDPPTLRRRARLRPPSAARGAPPPRW
jgi:alpha-1,2-mannosyltransferase